jgi:hypothetical protein
MDSSLNRHIVPQRTRRSPDSRPPFLRGLFTGASRPSDGLNSPPPTSKNWSARGENHKRLTASFITYFNHPIIACFRKVHTYSMQHFNCMQVGRSEPIKLYPF